MAFAAAPKIDLPLALPEAGGRARKGRRWGPFAISLALHAGVLLVGATWFAAVHVPSPAPRRLKVAAMELADPDSATDPAELDVTEPDLPPADLEVDIPQVSLAPDQASEECELPECDFSAPDRQPADVLDIPLSAAGESRPRPRPTPPAVQPRPITRRPAARPAARPHRRTGRALKLVHRPNLMQYYPAEARRRGIEGEALVEIRVDTRGVVVEAVIVRSSGSALLDRQALRLMYDYRFAAGDGGRSRVPVNFRLR